MNALVKHDLRVLFVPVLIFALLSLSPLMARDWKKIAGSAAAGAVIGGIADGKSGVVLGGVAGGAGGYVWDEVSQERRERNGRSTRDSAILIGATTAAGAATGGIIGGKTGAIIGAAGGAAGGYIYDRKSNKRDR